MIQQQKAFEENEILHELKHYLPAQAPLKDFIHHNTLHAFQQYPFFEGIARASKLFGYKTTLSLEDYRKLYASGKISHEAIVYVLSKHQTEAGVTEWLPRLLNKRYNLGSEARVGSLRAGWEKYYHVDLDVLVHPILFRIICSYLDQGIGIWNFPVLDTGFLNAIIELEKNTFASFFTGARAKELLMSRCKMTDLLEIVVGEESLYTQYLFDQQFAHQGWSGMVAKVEEQPETLMDQKRVSLRDFIMLELLLEIDALDAKFGSIWAPIAHLQEKELPYLFSETPYTELDRCIAYWQEAFEWTYYNGVLSGLSTKPKSSARPAKPSFQAVLCIDDRELSLRDHLERCEPTCATYASPGFFGVEFFFQPEHGKSYTKQCPATVTPKFLIKEIETKLGRKKDLHLAKHSHNLLTGSLMAPTLGLWSAFRLSLSIFFPRFGASAVSSFSHMDRTSRLSIRYDKNVPNENGLQIGFAVNEMADRVFALLNSIGLVNEFGSIVYIMGHGASSANNPHYAAYNCGACSGRPGSVNARVFAAMVNDPEVRKELSVRGLEIPDSTWFIGACHDTTRDEAEYYDEECIPEKFKTEHQLNKKTIENALDLNAKERARRFELINHKGSAKKIHQQILLRSVSLFEPRPELNHATNALCIVGRRELTRYLFLDRRAFANSYNCFLDPEGKLLADIMRPLGPVCGGINLEYYFSRVDNQKLGAGSKLPHNVMGLFGVANGFDGDLRPGLPSQMIEVHDPLRLLIVVEHKPDIVLKTIKSSDTMYEWYKNEWIHLVCIEPETAKHYEFWKGEFIELRLDLKTIQHTNKISDMIESSRENLPVYVTTL